MQTLTYHAQLPFYLSITFTSSRGNNNSYNHKCYSLMPFPAGGNRPTGKFQMGYNMTAFNLKLREELYHSRPQLLNY